MKVAVIRPNYEAIVISPPLGLGYISSYLKKEGHEVLFIDALNERLDPGGVANKAKECQVACITVLSDFYNEAKKITKKLKELNKIVILGGVHPTVLPKETLEETGADFVVIGEGEITIAELVYALEHDLDTSNIKGIRSKENPDKYIPREFIKNLEDLPFPDWESMNPNNYKKFPRGFLIKNLPFAPVMTTRGCPGKCTFCASPKFWGQRLRFRSPENVIEEIEYLVKNFGVKEIHFEDDNIITRKDHAMKIFNSIIEKKLNISIATTNGIRADFVDEELLRLMKKAGCYYVAFGVESGNPEILKTIKKGETLDDISKAVRLANKVGLMVQGFFIIGLPGETVQTIKNSIKFAKKLPFDRAIFNIFDLVPGSKLWEEHKDELKIDYYSKRTFQEATWTPDTITPEELEDWQTKALLKFFLRPRQIYSLIKHFKIINSENVWTRLKNFRFIE